MPWQAPQPAEDFQRVRRVSADESLLPSVLRAQQQMLLVKIEMPARGKKLATISKLLDQLGLVSARASFSNLPSQRCA